MEQDKEIIYQIEVKHKEDIYVRPVHAGITRILAWISQITSLIIIIQAIVLTILDFRSRTLWILLCVFLVYLEILVYYINHIKRKKIYKKLVATGENCYLYTFYRDSVTAKSTNAEVNLKYDTAKRFTENEDTIMVVFEFERWIAVNKAECTQEQLDFIRSIVPVKNQNKAKKRKIIGNAIGAVIGIACVIMFSYSIYRFRTYYPAYTKYQCTTFRSFVQCVQQENVKDVKIIDDKYIEYTFTGKANNKRYYTVYTGDIKLLIKTFDEYDVNWEFD